MPEPSPNASMSTLGVRTPSALAICRFCVTARTKSPRRVRVSRMYTSSSTNAANAMMTMRLYGSTTLVMISMPPDIHAGFSTWTFCAPKIVRTAWIRIRLRPHVASSVSSGRP